MKHIDINKIRRAMALVAVMIVTMASAMAQTAVNYIDKDGKEQTCETYIEVGTTTTAWNAGWYLVNGEVVISGGVTVTGEVHLILADGASLTVTGAAGKAGVNVSGAANSLTVYGQAEGTGKLTANGTGYANGTGGGAGIGGNDMQSGGNITVNGGIVTANGGGGGAGIGGGCDGSAYNIEINRGTVTANGSLLSTGIGEGRIQKKYLFTVAENKTVEFSKGNLYYDGKDFKFEANQWDYASKWNTGHVSHFFWSKMASVAYAENYTDRYASEDDVFFAATLYVEGDTWFTLTEAEWDYLLGKDNSYRANAASLRKWVMLTVSGGVEVNGLVILPDGADYATAFGGGEGTIKSVGDLATHGAVFLPAAGYRGGKNVDLVGGFGGYWSSTPNDEENAYFMYFSPSSVTTGKYDRNRGSAVRLVREPKAPNTTVTLTLANGGNTVAEALGVAWNEADVVNVYNGETNVGSLSCRNYDGSTATFTGYINENLTAGTLLTFRRGTTPAFTEQNGVLATLKTNYSLEGTAEYNASGNYNNISMGVPYALMKLDLSAFGTADGTTVTISAGSPSATVASVTGVTMSSTELYVAMPVAESREYTFSGNSLTVRKTWTLEANRFYTKDGSSTGGAIVVGPPVFSVSADKTVEFAPGNLYWDGTAEGGKKWKFEANQWDYRTWAGKECYISGTPATTTTPDNNCGLFKWSDEANAVTGDNSLSGDLFCKSDFTVGGQTGWGTLTKAEWNYLLKTRANAASLRKWVTLTLSCEVTVKGLVILPDGDALSPTIPDTINEAFLSSNNAVFLPAVGVRNGTVVDKVNSYGFYWSSSPATYNNYVYYMYFFWYNVDTNEYSRNSGYCVRLVR